MAIIAIAALVLLFVMMTINSGSNVTYSHDAPTTAVTTTTVPMVVREEGPHQEAARLNPLDNYDFYPGIRPPDPVIPGKSGIGGDHLGLAALCESVPECVSFASGGALRSSVSPLSTWVIPPEWATHPDWGTFVRKGYKVA